MYVIIYDIKTYNEYKLKFFNNDLKSTTKIFVEIKFN